MFFADDFSEGVQSEGVQQALQELMNVDLSQLSLFELIFASIFVQNIILSQFLGLCPFIGVSNHSKNAWGMALASTLVLTLVSALSYPIFHWLLVPFGLEFLKTLVLIVIIAVCVQLLELCVRWLSPMLHQTLGLYLPLITSNCAVLGVALLVIHHDLDSWWQAVAFGASAGAGFSIVLLLLSELRHKIRFEKVPAPFRGNAIGLITAGIMSMAFMGFQGL